MSGPPVVCHRSPGTLPWLLAHFSIAGTCITAALAILARMAVRRSNASLMKAMPVIGTAQKVSAWRDPTRQPGLASTPFKKAWLTRRLAAGPGSPKIWWVEVVYHTTGNHGSPTHGL